MSTRTTLLAALLLLPAVRAQDESFEKARARWEVALREKALLPEDGGFEIVEVEPRVDVLPFYLLEVRPEVPGYPGQITSAAASPEEVLGGDDGIARILRAAGFPANPRRFSLEQLISIDQALHSMRWPVYLEPDSDAPEPCLQIHEDGSVEFQYWFEVLPSSQKFNRILRIAADGATVSSSEPH